MQGIVRTAKTENFDVPAISMLDALDKEVVKSFKLPFGAYINEKGQWETWYDTGHGSGMYDQHRDATQEEKDIMLAFKIIRHKIQDIEE